MQGNVKQEDPHFRVCLICKQAWIPYSMRHSALPAVPPPPYYTCITCRHAQTASK